MVSKRTHLDIYSGIWTNKQLKHLLRRTMYGVTQQSLDSFKDKTMEECIESILSPSSLAPLPSFYFPEKKENIPFGSTDWVFFPNKSEIELEEAKRILFQVWQIELIRDQKNSIIERMNMFWQNHFACNYTKANDSRYTYHYFNTIRTHALGNFKTLLYEITTCPLMLVFLDGTTNSKEAPNENYARELQELFTVGKGAGSHYTENDVKTAVKVLSGWKDEPVKIQGYFDASLHNTEDKTFSEFYNNHTIKGQTGQAGALEIKELIEMLCRQPETAKFICRKLYRWFVKSSIDEQVENEIIIPLANIMMNSNYEIKLVLKALLSSSHFYNNSVFGSIIKSPVDFVGELSRTFNIKNEFMPEERFRSLYELIVFMPDIGQELCEPPSVAGWSAYYSYPLYDREWISNNRFVERCNIIATFTNNRVPQDPENNHRFDILHFVASLPSVGNHRLLLEDTAELLFCVPINLTQLEDLAKLINTKVNEHYNYSWNDLWEKYCNTQNEEVLIEEVKSRLRSVFTTMLTYPEYQIR